MDIQNPEKIEIEGLKTIHKLCKFGANHNMEGCSFTEIVERMFDELSKAQTVPEGFVLVESSELEYLKADSEYFEKSCVEWTNRAYEQRAKVDHIKNEVERFKQSGTSLDLEYFLESLIELSTFKRDAELFKVWQEAQAVPEWISTSERMPNEGEEVLVHSLGQVRQVTRDSSWAGGFKERNCYGWQAAYNQSHWMPKSIELPEDYNFYYENDAKQKNITEAQEQGYD